MILFAALVLAAAPHSHMVQSRPVAHARAATDWTRVASATPAGGFVMGNPAAKVKLVEYGALTCPHCRHFDESAAAPLAAYVRTGRVSWEFRPFLLSAYDIPATLTASCNGAASFFPMMHALYAAQPDWIAKMQAIPADRLEAIRKLSRPEQFAAIGTAAGFPAFGAAHGVPAAKISGCLRNPAAAERAVKVTADASEKFQVHSTPTFIINGATVDYSSSATVWAAVEAQLKSSLAKVQ